MTGDEERERDETAAEKPPPEQLEEENPVESPAQPAAEDPAPDAARERASTTTSPEPQVGESTEGLTVGGTDKEPPDA
jgi:hypothetical protein